MKKIIKDFRLYGLKVWAKRLLLQAAISAGIAGLWLLWRSAFEERGGNADVLFITALIAVLLWCLYGFYLAVGGNPARLEKHIRNLPDAEILKLIEEYKTAKPENGRYFLTDFLVFFPCGGGLIRYAKIHSVTVFDKGLWLESLTRSVLMKTTRKEDRNALAEKFRERIPPHLDEDFDEDYDEDETDETDADEIEDNENNTETEEHEAPEQETEQ